MGYISRTPIYPNVPRYHFLQVYTLRYLFKHRLKLINYIQLLKLPYLKCTLPRLWGSRCMSFETFSEFRSLSFHPSVWRRPTNIRVYMLCIYVMYISLYTSVCNLKGRLATYLSNSGKIFYNSSWRAVSCPDSRAFASTKLVTLGWISYCILFYLQAWGKNMSFGRAYS